MERRFAMFDIVKMSEELRSKLQHETDLLMSDRLMTRDVLEARAKELEQKRDDELRRVEEWAKQQRSLIKDVFEALLGEVEADRERNEANIVRMKGVTAGRSVDADEKARQLKAAE
jgi:hypothetical protein